MPEVAPGFAPFFNPSQIGQTSEIDQEFNKWLQETFPASPYSRTPSEQNPSRAAIARFWATLSDQQKMSVFGELKATKSVPAAQAAISKITAASPSSQSTASGPLSPVGDQDYPGTSQYQQELGQFANPSQYNPAVAPNATSYMLNGVSETDANAIAASLGLDPHMLQQQYDSFQSGMQAAQGRRMGGKVGSGTQPVPESLQQFALSMAQVQQGQWMPAINALNFYYREQSGNNLAPEDIQKLLAGFNALPKDTQNTIAHAMISMAHTITTGEGSATGVGAGEHFDPTAAVQGFLTNLSTEASNIFSGSLSPPAGGQGSIMSNIATAHPNSAALIASQLGTERADAIQQLTAAGMPPDQITDSLVQTIINAGTSASGTSQALTTYLSFMQAHKITPTAALITKLLSEPYFDPSGGTAEPGTGGATLLALPSPVHGLNLGGYISSYNTLQTLWGQYFGTGKTPSNSQIAWGVGKSQQQILDYINNSASSVAGVTIGRYNDIANLIQNFNQPTGTGNTNSFSSVVDDSIVNSLHQAISQKTKAPTEPKK